jgi:peptide/nickel transport system permease protein
VTAGAMVAQRARVRGRRARPTVALATGVFVLIALAGLLAPWLAPHDPARQDLRARLAAPTGASAGADGVVRPLGSDHLGRDVASRTLYAIRTSLGIAIVGTLVGATLGSLLGLTSGMAGGRVDDAIMFAVDVQLALPFILLALVAIAVFGTHPVVLVGIIGLSGWDGYARVVRGQVLSAKRAPYVEASRALGVPPVVVALRHVLPNVGTPIVVLASFNFTSIVLLESSLSFLGLGVQPPGVSLGLLIAYGREYLLNASWMTLAPAAVLVLLTMSVGIVSDALRDRFDPRTA